MNQHCEQLFHQQQYQSQAVTSRLQYASLRMLHRRRRKQLSCLSLWAVVLLRMDNLDHLVSVNFFSKFFEMIQILRAIVSKSIQI